MEQIRELTFENGVERIDFPWDESVELTYPPNKTGRSVDVTVIALGKEFFFPLFAQCRLEKDNLPGEASFRPLIYSIVSDGFYPVIILFGLLSVLLIDIRKQFCGKLVDLFRTYDDDSGFYGMQFEKLSDGFLIIYESGVMRLKKNGEVLWHTPIYWDDIYKGIHNDCLVLSSEYGEFAPDDWGISLADGKKVRLS